MTQNWKPPATPLVTVDAVIRTPGGIVLIKRKYPPLGWALPGGFVEVGETVLEAVVREAKEETGLEMRDLWLVGVYSDPDRDPRFHTVSVVYAGTSDGIPEGADDAAQALAFNENQLPEPIVFDHRRIIKDFRRQESNYERLRPT